MVSNESQSMVRLQKAIRQKSDVDILIQLMKSLDLEFVELAYHLEKVLKKKVDLATFNTLKRSLESPRYRHIASDIERTLSYV